MAFGLELMDDVVEEGPRFFQGEEPVLRGQQEMDAQGSDVTNSMLVELHQVFSELVHAQAKSDFSVPDRLMLASRLIVAVSKELIKDLIEVLALLGKCLFPWLEFVLVCQVDCTADTSHLEVFSWWSEWQVFFDSLLPLSASVLFFFPCLIYPFLLPVLCLFDVVLQID